VPVCGATSGMGVGDCYYLPTNTTCSDACSAAVAYSAAMSFTTTAAAITSACSVMSGLVRGWQKNRACGRRRMPHKTTNSKRAPAPHAPKNAGMLARDRRRLLFSPAASDHATLSNWR